MKNLTYIICLILPFSLLAQSYEISENKLSQFFFDEKIESFRTSLEPDFISIKNDNNVLFIQLMTLDVTEFNVIIKTTDGLYYSLDMKPNELPENLNFFVKKKSSINLSEIGNDGNQDGEVKYTSNQSVFQKILNKKGFIRTSNTTHNQKIHLYLKGIYVDSEKIYFRFELQNKSNINYQIEKINFFISEQGSSVMTSTDNAPVSYIQSYQEPRSVKGKEKQEFIYVFTKFTIDNDKKFTINIVETNGDRILNLNLYNNQFSEAKSINF